LIPFYYYYHDNNTGVAWLFLGVANSDSLLYDDEFQEFKKKYPNNFRVDYALSREQNNKSGGKMYIQDKLEEYSDEIFARLDKGGHIYFCGLKVRHRVGGYCPLYCSYYYYYHYYYHHNNYNYCDTSSGKPSHHDAVVVMRLITI